MKYKDIRGKINNHTSNSFFKIHINDKDIFYTNNLFLVPIFFSKYRLLKMDIVNPSKKDIQKIKEKFVSIKKIQCIFDIYLKEV